MKQSHNSISETGRVIAVTDISSSAFTLNKSHWRLVLLALAVPVTISLAIIPIILARSARQPKPIEKTKTAITNSNKMPQVANLPAASDTATGESNILPPAHQPPSVASTTNSSVPTNPAPVVTTITHGSQMNAGNTGYSGSLTTVAGFTASTPGQVYQNINVNGDIDITAANVTIKNCKVNAVRWYGIHVLAGASATIENCEIYGTIDRVTGVLVEGTASLSRVNVHDVDIGLYSISGAHMTVIESYVHDLWAFNFDNPPSTSGGSHNDPIKGSYGGNIIVQRSKLVASYSPGKTAAYAGISGDHHVDGGTITIQNSYLDGTLASYVEYAVNGAHLTATGNILIHPDHRHAISINGQTSNGVIDQWTNNKWEDGSAAIPGG